MDDEQMSDEAPEYLKVTRPLILLREDNTRLIFNDEYVTLGRAADCDIVLPNACVSPLHAAFCCGNRVWTITDEDSVNGIFVNNQRLEARDPYVLHNADVISIPVGDPVDEFCFLGDPPAHVPVRKAPDGTVILAQPNIVWSDQLIFVTSAGDEELPKTGRSFLKFDQDGYLYSDIPSPKYLIEHNFRQCECCGAFAEEDAEICPECGEPLSSGRMGYVDPVVYTQDYQEIKDELEAIIDRKRSDLGIGDGLGWCFSIWHLKQEILRDYYHILWRTPDEMNPHIIFD